MSSAEKNVNAARPSCAPIAAGLITTVCVSALEQPLCAAVNPLKIVGRRRPPQTPQECHALAVKQYRAAIAMSPYPRPRGFVFKARTWEEWERWRREHPNPWLW